MPPGLNDLSVGALSDMYCGRSWWNIRSVDGSYPSNKNIYTQKLISVDKHSNDLSQWQWNHKTRSFFGFLVVVFSWLWRWLVHRLLKHQSLTTVLFRTPINQMIYFNQGMLLLGSNHFLNNIAITIAIFIANAIIAHKVIVCIPENDYLTW